MVCCTSPGKSSVLGVFLSTVRKHRWLACSRSGLFEPLDKEKFSFSPVVDCFELFHIVGFFGDLIPELACVEVCLSPLLCFEDSHIFVIARESVRDLHLGQDRGEVVPQPTSTCDSQETSSCLTTPHQHM